MEITFAGTGSGKVSLERYFSTFLLSLPDCSLLVDSGDGCSRALEQSRIDITNVNSILVSHFHPDHLNGLSSLIIQMKMRKRKLQLNLIVHENLTERLEQFLETGYVFKERLGFEMNIRGFKTGESFFISDRLSFTPKENSHLDKYEGTFEVYKSGRDKSLLVSSAFLFKAEELKIFYTGDMGGKDDLYLFQREKPEVLISETTHVEPDDILQAVWEQRSIRKIFLTHISDEAPLREWLGRLKPAEREKFIITHDTMKWDSKSFI